MSPVRRMDIMWVKNEVEDYDKLKAKTQALKQEMPSFAKEIIEKNI